MAIQTPIRFDETGLKFSAHQRRTNPAEETVEAQAMPQAGARGIAFEFIGLLELQKPGDARCPSERDRLFDANDVGLAREGLFEPSDPKGVCRLAPFDSFSCELDERLPVPMVGKIREDRPNPHW